MSEREAADDLFFMMDKLFSLAVTIAVVVFFYLLLVFFVDEKFLLVSYLKQCLRQRNTLWVGFNMNAGAVGEGATKYV